MGDGVGRAVIAPDLSEGVENELPAEDLVVEGQGLAGCAREVQVRLGRSHDSKGRAPARRRGPKTPSLGRPSLMGSVQ